jgi:hypothetical protein
MKRWIRSCALVSLFVGYLIGSYERPANGWERSTPVDRWPAKVTISDIEIKLMDDAKPPYPGPNDDDTVTMYPAAVFASQPISTRIDSITIPKAFRPYCGDPLIPGECVIWYQVQSGCWTTINAPDRCPTVVIAPDSSEGFCWKRLVYYEGCLEVSKWCVVEGGIKNGDARIN